MRRGHNDYRLAVTGNSSDQLIEDLAAFLKGETRAGLSSGHKALTGGRKLVFVFSGQGSQWFGMGRTLLLHEPVFREVIERCALALRPHTDWSLIAELAGTDADKSRLNEVDVIQPALFAVQVALAALWRSWGIEPDAVVGHSMGEVAAAYVAGALSLEDAALVICTRSKLVKRTVGQGAMASVELSIEDARRAIVGYEDRVSIAVSTSPTSTVLSGDPKALAEILEQLKGRDVFCRMVKVDFASHSPQMEPLRAELLDALEEVQPRLATIPIYSTVLDTVADGSEFDAHYWARNLRDPVLFSASIQRLLEDGYDTFLELSAHPILLSGIQQGMHHSGTEGTVLASIRRDEDEHTAMLRSLGLLYNSGYAIDWSRIYPERGESVRLPGYPWQRQRCWLEPGADRGQPIHSATRNSLLGQHFKSAESGGAEYWEIRLDKESLPFLDDHKIEGVAALPASLYVEMASAAAQQALGSQSIALTDVEFHRALFLPDGASTTIQVIVATAADGSASFQIHSSSVQGGPWTLHASGKASSQPLSSIFEEESPAEFQLRSSEKISGLDYYRQLSENAIQYGPFFQTLTQLWLDDKTVLGELRVPDGDFNAYQLHPAILDGCLQVLGAAVATEAKRIGKQGIYIPTRIGRLRVLSRPGAHLWCRARVLDDNAGSIVGELRLLDEAGQLGGRATRRTLHLARRRSQRKPRRLALRAQVAAQRTRRGKHAPHRAREPGSSLPIALASESRCGKSCKRTEKRASSSRTAMRMIAPTARTFAFVPTSPKTSAACSRARWIPINPHAVESSICGVSIPRLQVMPRAPRSKQARLSVASTLCRLCRRWRASNGVSRLASGWSLEERKTPAMILSRSKWLKRLYGDWAELSLRSIPHFGEGWWTWTPSPVRRDSAAHQLFDEISAHDGENQLAFRNGQRLVARLVRRQRIQRSRNSDAMALRTAAI